MIPLFSDVDISRPDEKSVMTYVASYYHTFARMKNEQKSGKRIANVSLLQRSRTNLTRSRNFASSSEKRAFNFNMHFNIST